jgi:hypothetical protein
VGDDGHLGEGKDMAKGGYFWPWLPFIGVGEREGQGGFLKSATDANVELVGRTGAALQVPLSWVTDRWATVDILKLMRVQFG